MFDVDEFPLNNLVPKYLLHAYIYYRLGTSIISDSDFDSLARRIYKNWDTINHPDKKLIDKEGLKSGGSYIKFTKRIEHAALYLMEHPENINNSSNINHNNNNMKFDILALRKAIDKWSMNIGEEDIHIHVPDNRKNERNHLGLSEICGDCTRASWYSYRKIHKVKFPPRLMRLFQRGHREEFFFSALLRGVGLTVWEKNPKTGKSFKVSECSGHLQGTMDRVARDTKGLFSTENKAFLVEFKTSNDARFKLLVKDGLKKSNPKYYGQIQGYMGLESNLHGCLFMSINKNDDEIHIEWVTPESDALQHILSRAEDIINATAPPPRISHRKAFWKCKMCDFKGHCFDVGKKSDKNCRSCRNARPVEDGQWKCVLSNQTYGALCDRWEDCNVK